MKKILSLPIFALLVFASTVSIHNATAVTTIDLTKDASGASACVTMLGGTWTPSPNTCTISSLTLGAGDSLTVEKGVTLVIHSNDVGGVGGSNIINGVFSYSHQTASGGSTNGASTNGGTINVFGTMKIISGTGGNGGSDTNSNDDSGTSFGNLQIANGGNSRFELDNNGIINVKSTGSLVVTGGLGGNGGTVSNSGTTSYIFQFANGGNSNGVLKNTGGTINVEKDGSITVKSGTDGLKGTVSNSGTYDVVLQFANGGNANGGLDNTGGTINNKGDIKVNCKSTFTGNAVVGKAPKIC